MSLEALVNILYEIGRGTTKGLEAIVTGVRKE